jgi:hypothetical protein
MPVDENIFSPNFVHSETFKRATDDEKMADTMKDFLIFMKN